MKRSPASDDRKMKKVKVEETEPNQQQGEEETETETESGSGWASLDENLVLEVLKHVDARTLGVSACVSKVWNQTAQDERLWELICTRQWANIGCANHQLRSVVLALGGFRRLHSLYIWPLTNPQSQSQSSSTPPWPPFAKPPTRWGKDEVNLSLSLLSIRFYEKMSSTSRKL